MRGSMLFSSKEPAQNGRDIKRAAQKSSEFLHCLAARIRALCAPEWEATSEHGAKEQTHIPLIHHTCG